MPLPRVPQYRIALTRYRAHGWHHGTTLLLFHQCHARRAQGPLRAWPELGRTVRLVDVVKRYLHPYVTAADLATRPDLAEPALRAIVEGGAALEVNSSGLRYPGAETYPSAAVVARYRELGGTHVVVGSDAHSRGSFAARLDAAYGHLSAAGFESLAFRRGSDRVRIPLEPAALDSTVDALHT